MSHSFTIIRKHDTYFRDSLIFGLIGFVAAFVYFLLEFFARDVPGTIGLVLFVFFFIFKLKAKFKPDSFLFERSESRTSVWRRSEFKNDEPYVRELVGYETTSTGIKIIVKDIGTSSIKTSLQLSFDEYSEANVSKLVQFLELKKESEVTQKNIVVANQRNFFPADFVGYLITIALFFSINVVLNEDPKKYSYLNFLVSPVDYEFSIPVGEMKGFEESTIREKIENYKLNRDDINKPFPKRYVSIQDFESSLQITHFIEYTNGNPQSLVIEFSSPYDEKRMKRIYDLIAKDMHINVF